MLLIKTLETMVKLQLQCSFLLLIWASVHAGQETTESLPINFPPAVYDSTGSSGSTCGSQDTINEELRRARETILNYYKTNTSYISGPGTTSNPGTTSSPTTSSPSTTYSPPCSCEGAGGWTRVAYLNMSDPNQQCPSKWKLTTTPVRGCGRTSTRYGTCRSVFYPTSLTFSSVCGRVNAYQFGTTSAFYPRNNIDFTYVSGVSITHGPPGSRQHIWTFAAAVGDNCTDNIYHLCPCSNVNLTWPYQVPSFIGNDYFCETGHHGAGGSCRGFTYYPDDPLWDGQNCAPSSMCCELNNPPWFCKTLPQPTGDALEIRHCHRYSAALEDTLISLIDIYVK